ncbi:porin [Leptolyngbya sp. FACHB-541]|uniref:carbohydrate porin n=1 Tax=Leptolyngbya sp. FACHB-541 TaxID=2692810 RepID=UPI0016872E41|nr:carbohydrate porin [Leptolyngbya sp. FACHB-541]MBD2000406.1 porin [Leptolyngbya sp. FACHB-541]
MKVGLFKSVLLNFLLFSGAYFVCFEFGFLTGSTFSLGKANAAPIPDAILDESSSDSATDHDSLVDSETAVVIAEAKGVAESAESDSHIAALPTDETLNRFADENDSNLAGTAPPAPAPIAAVTVSAWRSPTPSQSDPQSDYQTEDELIAQMTGATASPESANETATETATESTGNESAIAIPVPTPGMVPPVSAETGVEPTSVMPGAIAPVPPTAAIPTAATPTTIASTAIATTDVGSRLFTPDQSSNTAAISAFEAAQINQVLPSVAASPTLPTTAPVASQAAQLTPPGESLTSQASGENSLLRSTALTPPSITLQGVYIFQDSESSARARLRAVYPITPNLQAGATLDLTEGDALTDSPDGGLSINELYLAASLEDVPNLRFVIGQLDLTSYFDRNSFAKDGASQFFNPVFQTNPALTATGIGSRPAALVNWSLTDNIEARAAVFSSSRNMGDFDLDGFAGEVAFWLGNAIIRGTYAIGSDAGNDSGFNEIFDVDRGDGEFGLRESDREESYGVNAEIFVPELNMGIFARYGRYENRDLDASGDTYSGGVTFLDLFMPSDRLGLAYGRGLSNESLRSRSDRDIPDVAELFYDFSVLPNLRLGFTLQQIDGFSETIAGFRIRTEFDVTPRGSL